MEKQPRHSTEKLEHIANILKGKPFQPHLVLPNAYFQTIGAIDFPRFRESNLIARTKREIIPVSENAQIAVDFSLQENPEKHPTVVVIHGINGSSESRFSLGIGHKAFRHCFNIARINLRGAGGTEKLSQTLYHAGQSEDILAVLKHVRAKGLNGNIYLAGFSFGGNICLKLAGELGENAKGIIAGVAVISSLADPVNNGQSYLSKNEFFSQNVLRGLKNAVRKMAKIYPDIWDTSKLDEIDSVYKWDSVYMVNPGGFESAEDYYEKVSALPHVPKTAVPTLAIHSEDDPLLSSKTLRSKEFTENPHVVTLITQNGGHGGFIAARKLMGELDRHWAENRAIEFFRLIEEFNLQSKAI